MLEKLIFSLGNFVKFACFSFKISNSENIDYFQNNRLIVFCGKNRLID